MWYRNKSLFFVGLCVLAVCSPAVLLADSHEDVSVAVGEEFQISLEANPSTGYSWSLAEPLPSWLKQTAKTSVAANPGLPGGGGTEYWTFRATASGNTTLTFQYMRSWVGVPERTCVVQVTAETGEPNADGFETGDFSVLDWGHQGPPWQATSTRPYSGTYCARSGAIGDDGVSTLTCTCDCRAGQIGFAVEAEGEANPSARIDEQEIRAERTDAAFGPRQRDDPGGRSGPWPRYIPAVLNTTFINHRRDCSSLGVRFHSGWPRQAQLADGLPQMGSSHR
jgi:predicted secreted protein